MGSELSNTGARRFALLAAEALMSFVFICS
jgi:hypothetical protein